MRYASLAFAALLESVLIENPSGFDLFITALAFLFPKEASGQADAAWGANFPTHLLRFHPCPGDQGTNR
jgi:hypothetical protein